LSLRFYLRELFDQITARWSEKTDGVTNYAPLIKAVRETNRSGEPVLLVTFNYDLLLERALVTFGFNITEPNQQLDAHPVLKLFKLHGSINWSRLVNLPGVVNLSPVQIIDRADRMTLSNDFVLANAMQWHDRQSMNGYLIPAIAVPIQTKSEEYFECPPEHLTYLREALPKVEKILIIGWQAKEAHFLGMLRNALPKLGQVMVVGAAELDAKNTLTYFLENIGLDVYKKTVGSGGFTDFIIKREGEAFLRA
jgi:hypothetical protein